MENNTFNIIAVFLTSLVLAGARSNITDFLIRAEHTQILGRELDCSAVDECEEAPGQNGKICGTNGRTYRSLCEFMRAYCKEGHVEFNHHGECSASEKCLGHREAAMRDDQTQKGVFIPSCKPDGSFEPVQCHKGTEYCWCSTPAGHAIAGTAIHNQVPDCSNFTKKPSQISSSKKFSSSQKGGCEGSRRKTFNKNMVKNMIQEYKRGNNKKFDSDISMQTATLQWKFEQLDTRKDGKLRRTELKVLQKIVKRNFKPRKCATKFPKFCDVNADKKISLKEWTNCFISEDPDYLNNVLREEKQTKKGGKKNSGPKKGKPLPCEYESRQAKETSATNGNQEIYIPKCDENGMYHPVQCYGSLGKNLWFCFCVNVETGDMIENTSVQNGTPECPVSWPKCPPNKEKMFLQSLVTFFTAYAEEKLHDFKKYKNKPNLVEEEKTLEKIFAFLDKNQNNHIEGKEKKQLRKIIRKKPNLMACGKKIHVVCDRNDDGKISFDEFLSCILSKKDNSNYNFVQGKGPIDFILREKKGKNPFIEVITAE